MLTYRLLLAPVLACLACTANATDYKLTRVDVSGAQFVALSDINNRNQVVGSYAMSDADYGQAFIYSNGKMQLLSGPSGAIGSVAFGISDNGSVVGSFTTNFWLDPDGSPAFAGPQGFIYADGHYEVVSLSGANETYLRGISPDGRYVSGYARFNDGTHGFTLDRLGGGLTLLGSGNGTIVAQGINANGLVVGNSREFTGARKATSFTYDVSTGQLSPANISGVSRTSFRDISSDGTIAGFYTDALGSHGFMGSISSYQTFDFGAGGSTILEGINDARWLVGSANDEDGRGFGVLLAPVPEPSTWALMLAGASLIALLRRQSRRIGVRSQI